jgi:hypothetical protein
MPRLGTPYIHVVSLGSGASEVRTSTDTGIRNDGNYAPQESLRSVKPGRGFSQYLAHRFVVGVPLWRFWQSDG